MSREYPGSIYVPSEQSTAEDMVNILGVHEGDNMLDLGAGDGRVVVAAASRGVNAYGVEIDPSLVLKSKKNISENGLSENATVFHQSFWDIDFGNFKTITIFQSPFVMGPLQQKILRECKKGTRIASNTWEFPGLRPVAQKGNIRLYVI